MGLTKELPFHVPSIDLVQLIEFNSRDKEPTIYKFIADSLKLIRPSVIIYNDTVFVSNKLKGKVNVCVFLPRTDYSLGYPDWLGLGSNNFYEVGTTICTKQKSVLIQIFYRKEYDNFKIQSIPLIQFTGEINKQYKVYLPADKYYVFYNGKKFNLK